MTESVAPVLERHPKYREGEDPRADHRARARDHVPRAVGGRRTARCTSTAAIRVEMNSAIGPYKGGLRFHPTVYLGMLKFLAFEQIFKNALTTLPMGGGKGGADFDPKGKSDGEVMRFCQSFMTELQRHIGAVHRRAGRRHRRGRPRDRLPVRSVQADPQRVHRRRSPARASDWGGSLIRPEATGYGAVYFAAARCSHTRDDTLEGKTCLVSGLAATWPSTRSRSCCDLGAKPVTLSDSGGVHARPGRASTARSSHWVMDLKNERRGRIIGVRRPVPRRRRSPRRPAERPQPAVGHPGRLRVPQRHPERDQRQGRREPAEQRRRAS